MNNLFNLDEEEKNLDDDYKKRLNDKIIDYFTDKTKLVVPKSIPILYLSFVTTAFLTLGNMISPTIDL